MKSKVLVLSAHPDDGQLGCGGTIAKLISHGAKVYYPVLSWQEQDFTEDEIERACKLLGVEYLKNDFVVRELERDRQQVLEYYVKLRDKIKPDLVFLPSSFDTHQDHQVVHAEGVRAFRNHRMLGYELTWNNLEFKANCFSELERKHMEKKMKLAQTYKSQAGKLYMNLDLIMARARDRGSYIRVPYAEVFEVVRWII